MHQQTFGRLACGLILVGSTALSCSDDADPGGDGTTGGSSAGTGGKATPATGGTSPLATGGSPTASGGSPTASGGSPTASGGSPTASGGMTATGGVGGGPSTGGVSGAKATGGSMSDTGGGGSGGRPFGSGGRGGASGSGGASGQSGNSGSGGGSGGGAATGKSPGCGSTSAPKSGNYMIDVGGKSRSYILKVPDDYKADNPYRLIVAYHWLNGTAQNVASENYYGLWSLSQGSTIFVAPQGNGNAWRDAGSSKSQGGEDIAFTKALVTDLKSKLCIDNGRVFAEGFSMGGSMSYAAACAMGDVFRAVAAHSGGPMSGCVQHTKPVAYFMTHGTRDSVCTYPGFGVPQIEDFAKVNGCMQKAMPTPSGTAQSCVDFEGCMTGYPARACIFVGDHLWNPTGNWVSGETWKFFSQF